MRQYNKNFYGRLNAMNNWMRNVPMARYSSWKVGGVADFFFEPSSEQDLIESIKTAQEQKIDYTVIGRGSNILFPDRRVKGLIIRLGPNFSSISAEDTVMRVQAGAFMPCVARKSMKLSLTGLEHTIGIPGTIGGLTVMNGGSMRHNISENIRSVRTINKNTLESVVFPASACEFSYRKSIFQKDELIVTGVTLELQRGNYKTIHQAMCKILGDRRKKFPLREPSCGSTFKSNPDLYETYGPPGKIIETLGLKGKKVGGAMVSPQHANFIVNTGSATAKDILTLVQMIAEECRSKIGAVLETEFQLLPNQEY